MNEAPAGAQHPASFTERQFRLGQMQNTEVDHRRVKNSLAEGQLLGVALAKIDAGMEFLAWLTMAAEKSTPTTTWRCRRHVTGSGGDIKQLVALFSISTASNKEVIACAVSWPKAWWRLTGNRFPTAMFLVEKTFRVEHGISALECAVAHTMAHFHEAKSAKDPTTTARVKTG